MTSNPRPFTITVVLSARSQTGGGFHQAFTSLRELIRRLPKRYRVFVVDESNSYRNKLASLIDDGELAADSILSLPKKFSSLRDRIVVEEGYLYRFARWVLSLRGIYVQSGRLARFLDASDTDLVYFATPTLKAHELQVKPYIWTLWDLCHLDSPEFPEVRTSGKFEGREEATSRSLRKASLVVVDSKKLEDNARWSYGLSADKFVQIPFTPPQAILEGTVSEAPLPSVVTNIRKKYVFYPAQLWTHKNHLRIAQALSILIGKGHDIHAVFIGKDHGAGPKLREAIRALEVEDRVHFLGYVEDEVVPELYRQSLGLVMASYFGPTNIPPLEALQLDVPVVASNQHTEQLGNAALYFDPDDAEELADRILDLTDRAVVKRLRENGKDLLASVDYSLSQGHAELSSRIEALEKRLLR
jgi:hypothetical protein